MLRNCNLAIESSKTCSESSIGETMRTTSSGKSQICPSRLPSKKRKGSHDSSQCTSSSTATTSQQQQQQGLEIPCSDGLTNSFSSLDFDFTKRKCSHDSTISSSPKTSLDYLLVDGNAGSSLPQLPDSLRDAQEMTPQSNNFPLMASKLFNPISITAQQQASLTADSSQSATQTDILLTQGHDDNNSAKKDALSMGSASAANSDTGATAVFEQLEPLLLSKGLLKDDTHDCDTASGATLASSAQKGFLEGILLNHAISGANAASSPQLFEPINNSNLPSGVLFMGRDRFESLGSANDIIGLARRERLESWGGMSDLSGLLGVTNGLVSGLGLEHFTNEHDEDQAISSDANNSAFQGITSKSALERHRERLNSVASLSEASITGLPLHVEGIDVTIDIQAFVSATVASMGDQLAEIAGAMEYAVGAIDEDDARYDESEVSSVASPIIGAKSDNDRKRMQRPRTLSMNSGIISVDAEVLAAAVDAANAAAAALDLTNIGKLHEDQVSFETTTTALSNNRIPHSSHDTSRSSSRRLRRQLPLTHKGKDGNDPSATDENLKKPAGRQSAISEMEEEQIRERARVAASARSPLQNLDHTTPATYKPLKKRLKRTSPEPDKSKSNDGGTTPKSSNRVMHDSADLLDNTPDDNVPFAPLVFSSSTATCPSAPATTKPPTKDRANQKWECMFNHLVKFIDDRRVKETDGVPEGEKDLWAWDGNVPTNHKTEDGKALGRWVNNQRTAKSKGTLKEDRIRKLEDAGLKWSVLSPNSWNDTLEELRIYVEEQTKDGSEWDGNVPTNYQIKARPDGNYAGEDRNLGRWVNRQRSLKQAGKLRKDRQLALEKIGLKWCMLDSTSWDAMFEILTAYVKEKKATTGEWDGNVPAGYKTSEIPPKALGRWINRQRCSFVKNKLKQEYIDKLSYLGLKWSVHGSVDTTLVAEDDQLSPAYPSLKAKPERDEETVKQGEKNGDKPDVDAVTTPEPIASSSAKDDEGDSSSVQQVWV